MNQTHYRAPWSRKLLITTLVIVTLMAVVGYMTPGVGKALAIGIVVIGLVFSVRGYSVMEDAVVVHRLGWATRFPLQDIRAADPHPHAMMGSLRVFGIGGFFGSIGRFWNTILGSYQAYATDGERAVVLEMRNGGKIVVTPDRPVEFADVVRTRAGIDLDTQRS